MIRFNQYIDDVLSGKLVTGKLVRLAVERHVRDVAAGNWVFDEVAASKAIRLAEVCRHWKQRKAGQRIHLEPHQVFRLGSMWGWRDEEGLKRYRRALLMVGRKNGKTTEAALNAINHLYLDKHEPGKQIYSTANREEQARLILNDIAGIAKNTPELKDDFRAFYFRTDATRISFKHGRAKIIALGSNSKTQDGVDPSRGIVDEYHEHRDSTRYDIIESGMGGRADPVMETITTAGFNKNFPCYSTMRDTAVKVLNGQLTDERFFPMIHELDDGDDWNDEAMWVKANPNLGASVNLDYLQTRYEKAKNEGGATEVDFKTKNLNMWVDSATTWVQDDTWMRRVADDSLAIGPCYGGLDLAPVRDFSCLTLYWPDTSYFKTWTWINAANFEQRYEKYGVDLYKWRSDGWLRVTAGDTTDTRVIEADIKELRAKYDLRSIAYDRAHAAELVVHLSEAGLPMTPFSQQPLVMIHPTSVLERGLISGDLAHEGNPVMRWMMANVKPEIARSGDVIVSKGAASDKIDGVIATIMAIGEAMTDSDGAGVPGVINIDW